MATTEDELREAARLARDCAVTGQAVTLARWIGSGRRQLTPGQLLRKPDVPGAGAALGVAVPAKFRTMADVKGLHRPWAVAVAAGLLSVGDGWVAVGPALADWPPDDADLLAGWLSGLRAVCVKESRPQDEGTVLLLVIGLLTVLGQQPRPRNVWAALDAALHGLVEYGDGGPWDLLRAAARYREGAEAGTVFSFDMATTPLTGLVELLAGFGVLTGDARKPVLTALGRWTAGKLLADLPLPADPELKAAELIAAAARFGDLEQRGTVARQWITARDPVKAVREILAAAEALPAPQRDIAVGVAGLVGEKAFPAWREKSKSPLLGPAVREMLAFQGAGPEISEADTHWLAVERAAGLLADSGPDEALISLREGPPGANLQELLAAARATGHPDAEEVTRAVAEFAASGAPLGIDQVAELKVSLAGYRPATWRRIQVPVTDTLGDLHEVIQILFGWEGDHLHAFRVGKKTYSDPSWDLDDADDEYEFRVRDAFSGGAKVRYTYDFGADWEHEITLEKMLPREDGQSYPVCVAFRGDQPQEYWSEDDEDGAESFDKDEVNEQLARFGSADSL